MNSTIKRSIQELTLSVLMMMFRLKWVLVFFLYVQLLSAQSDAVPKGHIGYEFLVGQGFLRGKNENILSIGSSINGKVDIDVGLSSINSFSQYIVGGAYHLGGELNKAGIALGAGYVFFPKVKNYFIFSPTLYASSNLGGVILIPSISVEMATTEEFTFASSFGLGIFTKGQSALSFRPQFVFGADEAVFRLSIGLLFQS